MSLQDLNAGDALRIVNGLTNAIIAEFFVISDDTIDEDLVDSDVSVNIPVYGSPFLLFENPIGSKYTSATVNLEGAAESFDLVSSECASAGTFKVVKLVIGGVFTDQVEFIKGVVIGVSRKRKVTRGDGWVEGSISFITIP